MSECGRSPAMRRGKGFCVSVSLDDSNFSHTERRQLFRILRRTERAMVYLQGKGLDDAIKEKKRLEEKLKCA